MDGRTRTDRDWIECPTLVPSLSVGETMTELDMTQNERCGGGKRIIRKKLGGNY